VDLAGLQPFERFLAGRRRRNDLHTFGAEQVLRQQGDGRITTGDEQALVMFRAVVEYLNGCGGGEQTVGGRQSESLGGRRDGHHQADAGSGHLQHRGGLSTLEFCPGQRLGATSLTVDATASYLSFSDIASSGTPGNYTLTGAVAAFGRNIPTGTVSFLDTDSGDAVVGTAVLDPTTLGFILLPAEGSPATVGSRPQNTVLGDFNNDGKLDLAATNVNDNTISVLLGNGDGTFLQAAYASGAFPIALASGDFNRDGNLDLVAGNAGAATISVYFGNGDGTFLPQQTYAVGNGPQSIAVADFDGDGWLDLAVVDRNDRNVTILLGQTDGTFLVDLNVCEDPQTFPIGEAGQVIVAADFNGDGALDLAVTDAQGSQVDVLLGTGDGTFQGQVT